LPEQLQEDVREEGCGEEKSPRFNQFHDPSIFIPNWDESLRSPGGPRSNNFRFTHTSCPLTVSEFCSAVIRLSFQAAMALAYLLSES